LSSAAIEGSRSREFRELLRRRSSSLSKLWDWRGRVWENCEFLTLRETYIEDFEHFGVLGGSTGEKAVQVCKVGAEGALLRVAAGLPIRAEDHALLVLLGPADRLRLSNLNYGVQYRFTHLN